ncbi:MAG: glycosyltransferase family 2 protein [Planctomycetes bacterium]|nr:glycosyltransferase family 2 protein [Planctomycetota bacterium]
MTVTGRPRFSVVIPTYNRAELLRKTLASVLAQTRRDFEVIVVDDGSTDSTGELVAGFGDRVRFLRQRNAGPSAARNRGIAEARGDYVCSLDSDDLWFPWTLDTIAHAIAAAGEPTIIAGALLPFEREEELAWARDTPPVLEVFPDYLASSRSGHFAGSGMTVYSRSALAAHSGFDPALVNMEDHDLALRLGTARGFVKIVTPPTVAYRRHDGSIQTPARSAAGLSACLARERARRYPGGRARAGERRRLLGLHARPLATTCARAGRFDLAWQIYRQTFIWQLRERRLRFLLGLPLVALTSFALRGRSPSQC